MLRTRWRLILALLFTTCLLTLSRYSMSVAAPALGSTQNDGQDYVVQRGDSLSKISKDFYGAPLAYPVIVDATNLKAESDPRYSKIVNPRMIGVGQRLWIPNMPSRSAPKPRAADEVTDNIVTGTIGSGKVTTGAVRFVAPRDRSVMPLRFDVTMAAEGLTVEPAGEIHEGAGHFHILVDTDFVPSGELLPFDESHLHFGQGQMTTTLELEPGVHILRLQFANGAHLALEGEQYRDVITVTAAETITIPNEEAGLPAVRFVVPEDGAVVPPHFDVTMAAEGLTVEPAGEIHEGAGHFHILVDTDFVRSGELLPFDESHLHFGQGQMTTTLELEPGVHILRLQFANGAHLALEGEQYRDVITVTAAETITIPNEEAGLPAVRFVVPEDGAVVPPHFDVTMAAEGLTVEPAGEIHEGAGHFHILVDTDFVRSGELLPFDESHLHFGQGQMTTTLELEPGVHILRLQFANGAHLALEGDQYRDVITVTVAEK